MCFLNLPKRKGWLPEINEQLQFKYDNCRNSLELVQAMLDELNETIDETAAEAKDTVEIASLYQHELESYGHLLDSIELVDRRLAALKRKQSKIRHGFFH